MTEHVYAGYIRYQLPFATSWECSCGATGAVQFPTPPSNAEARIQWLQHIKADHTLHIVAEGRGGGMNPPLSDEWAALLKPENIIYASPIQDATEPFGSRSLEERGMKIRWIAFAYPIDQEETG